MSTLTDTMQCLDYFSFKKVSIKKTVGFFYLILNNINKTRQLMSIKTAIYRQENSKIIKLTKNQHNFNNKKQ